MYYKASFPLPPPPRPPPPSRDLGNVRESRADGFGTGQWREGGREGVSGCGPHQRGSGVRSASDGENASEKRGREGIRKQEAPRGLRADGRTGGRAGGRTDGRTKWLRFGRVIPRALACSCRLNGSWATSLAHHFWNLDYELPASSVIHITFVVEGTFLPEIHQPFPFRKWKGHLERTLS